MREAIVIRPKVAPLKEAREALEARQAAVVPPPKAYLHRDQWQRKIDNELPYLLRRQAS